MKALVCKLASGSEKAIPLASQAFRDNTLLTTSFGEFQVEIPDYTAVRAVIRLRQDKIDALRKFLTY